MKLPRDLSGAVLVRVLCRHYSYARIHQDLRERKCLIGANDLWIAASAMRHGLPLVTRNAGEFTRVEGLMVIGY